MRTSAADKKRRQQKLAVVGVVLLALVLFIQVPRTLKMINPGKAQESASPASEQAPAGPVPVVALTDTEPAPSKLSAGSRKDPFAARANPLGDPIVKTRQLGFRLVPDTQTAPTAKAGTASPRGQWVVVLRSVPVAEGHASAASAADAFRKLGLGNAGVFMSSKYPALRKGYFVVHGGRFTTRLSAWAALLAARRAGAPSPYVRSLGA